jgi:hypothetical protein
MLCQVATIIIYFGVLQNSLSDHSPFLKRLSSWHRDNNDCKYFANSMSIAVHSQEISGTVLDYLHHVSPCPAFLMTKYTGDTITEDIRPSYCHFPTIEHCFGDNANVVKLKLKPHAYTIRSESRDSQLYYQWSDPSYSYRFWESSRGYLLLTKPVGHSLMSNASISKNQVVVMLNHLLGKGIDKSFISRDFKLQDSMKPGFVFSNTKIKRGIHIHYSSKDHILGFLTNQELGLIFYKDYSNKDALRHPDDWLDMLFLANKSRDINKK